MISSRLRVRTALAVLLAVPMLAGAARAQDTRPTLAVLYFDNNSIGKDRADYEGMGKGVADLLINDIAARSDVRVVERERLQAILQEQGLARQGAIDNETAIRIGKLLNARHMITGGFMSTGKGQMVLTARTIEVETGVVSNPQRVQASGDDVLALIGQLSTSIASSLKLPAIERRTGDAGRGAHGAHGAAATQAGAAKPAAAAVAAAKPSRVDMRAALLYSKALEAQDNGDRAKADELYGQLVERFPDFEPARKNREKLRTTGH